MFGQVIHQGSHLINLKSLTINSLFVCLNFINFVKYLLKFILKMEILSILNHMDGFVVRVQLICACIFIED